ncbi:MAG TPA: glutamate--tRNA ligase, partial [bacterium]
MDPVRVRFAPSPTGELHVGGLRTALFNFLLARQTGGQFILRIEDTDQERFVPGAQEGIVEMLQWAGIDPDEGPHKSGPYGPYKQSERLHLYKAAAEKLIADGHAYRAYDTPEELDEMRKVQVAKGLPPKYDGRHRSLTAEDCAKFEAQGRKAVVRMKMPERDERIVVSDLVRGKVAFNSKELDDQVILKSDGFPTYHLAVVVDDKHMRITHMLRAEEWLPSTPKHLYLYKWRGYEVPQFAHLPLLLNDDRSKMSKRKGDVAAEAYRANGYLPEAMVNFLALLGWNP